jgi:hypothetical protein
MSPNDPERVFRSLIEQSALSEWALDGAQDFPHIPAKHQRLHRDTATCVIMLSGAIVSLYMDPQ